MKNLFTRPMRALVVLILCSVCIMISCDKKRPGVRDVIMHQLTSGTWTMVQVTVDGVIQNDFFTGFTLTFDPAMTYVSSGGEPVWPSRGSWSFTDDASTEIQRDDMVKVSILSINDSRLFLSIRWNDTTLGGGRTRSVSGDYVFELSR